ncbi:MAG: sporulation protein YtxC [Bacillota bacterium]
MHEVAIGTASTLGPLKERLDYEFRFLREEGITIRTREIDRGKLKFLGCSLQKVGRERFSPEDATEIMKRFIANALSDVIVNELEGSIIRNIIKSEHGYLTKEDQERLYREVIRAIDGDGDGQGGLLLKMYRKSKILGRILDYLESNKELVLEGFVNFRLKDYKQELEETIERVAEDLLVEKEYNDFVMLLKYYVDLQVPQVEEVHVLLEEGGKYLLLDSRGAPVQLGGSGDLSVTGPGGEVEYEDLLISSLVSLAPRRVVIHASPQRLGEPTLNILMEIFDRRVLFVND